jgi:hypothetical protein
MARMVFRSPPVTSSPAPVENTEVVRIFDASVQPAVDDPDLDDEPRAASWHESSWMLREGCEVREIEELDTVPMDWDDAFWPDAGTR